MSEPGTVSYGAAPRQRSLLPAYALLLIAIVSPYFVESVLLVIAHVTHHSMSAFGALWWVVTIGPSLGCIAALRLRWPVRVAVAICLVPVLAYAEYPFCWRFSGLMGYSDWG